jgi:hypothetical protein
VTQRAASGAALAAALLCTALPARAEKETIALEYRVSAGCPGRAAFVERVHTFTTKAEVASEDNAALRQFDVHVLRSGSSVRGELTIDDHGAKTTRQVTGTTCDEVVSALALATAIAVDPDALGGTPSDAPPKPPDAEPPPSAPKPKPVANRPPVALPPTQRKPLPRAAAAPDQAALFLDAGARVGSAMAPFPKLAATAELGLTYFEPLEFYVGGSYGKQDGHTDPVPDACPSADARCHLRVSELLGWLGAGYRLVALEPFSVFAHTAFELGQVQTTALDLTPARSPAQPPWLAVDVGVSGRLDAPGPVFFQANIDARAPLLPPGYELQSMSNATQKTQVYRAGYLGYLFGLSVGVHFL